MEFRVEGKPEDILAFLEKHIRRIAWEEIKSETLMLIIETLAEKKAQELLDAHEENYDHDSLEKKVSEAEQ